MWKERFEIIDFHTHILAAVDDGAPDIDTSLQMLSHLMQQGVDKVVSTSHYYDFADDIDSFIARRDEALFRLERHIKEHDLYLPEIIPAAEVRIFSGMWQQEQLERLCIGDTRNILLEMPYDHWSDWMYSEIYSLIAKGYTPIIAHLERYVDMIRSKEIENSLLSLEVMVQCNGTFVSNRHERRFVKKLLSQGRVAAIGSDCHNMQSRKPDVSRSFDYISRKFGDEHLEYIMKNSLALAGQK